MIEIGFFPFARPTAREASSDLPSASAIFPVADGHAEGDAGELRPHCQLELRAARCHRQVEIGAGPGEVLAQLPFRLREAAGVADPVRLHGAERIPASSR